jgi:hypothetical protein
VSMIIDRAINSLSEYLELKKKQLNSEWEAIGGGSKSRHQLLVPKRPAHCVECGNSDCFWAHSYFYRWAIEGDLEAIVAVPRFECSICTKVVSVLFGFLVPYRQFTVRVIAEAVERYILEETKYRTVAGELCGASYRPAHAQVWQWVQMFVSKAQEFLGLELQRACVESGKSEEQLIETGERVCPNAENAASQEKETKLNFSARALGLAELLLNRKMGQLQALQARFVQNVQSPLSIFSGRGIRLFTPQSSKHIF